MPADCDEPARRVCMRGDAVAKKCYTVKAHANGFLRRRMWRNEYAYGRKNPRLAELASRGGRAPRAARESEPLSHAHRTSAAHAKMRARGSAPSAYVAVAPRARRGA